MRTLYEYAGQNAMGVASQHWFRLKCTEFVDCN